MIGGQPPSVPGSIGRRPSRPFEHVALFHDGPDEFLRGAATFLEEGFDAGEPALVSIPAVRLDQLRRNLSPAAVAQTEFVPMEDLGRNPAWIIPAWRAFVTPHLESGRPVRAIGDALWPGRTHDELVECRRQDALTNLALADADGFRLLCPFDVSLPDDAIEAARRHHRHTTRGAELDRCDDYDQRVESQIDEPLSPRPPHARSEPFQGSEVWALRRLVAEDAARAGMPDEPLEDLTVAISEALSNSVAHGGGDGELSWWCVDNRFVCEVRDRGYISDPLAGRVRPRPEQGDGRGLWLMHQLCDLVQIRVYADGTQAVRLHLQL